MHMRGADGREDMRLDGAEARRHRPAGIDALADRPAIGVQPGTAAAAAAGNQRGHDAERAECAR